MKATAILSLLLLAVVTAGAQDLLRTNPNYVKAREMQLQADQAYNRGDYDKAAQLADDSRKLLAQASAETTARIQQLRASQWKTRAADRIAFAKGIKADVAYPEQWAKANALYDTAQKTYDAKDYDTSIASSQAAYAALEGIRPK